MPRHASYVPHGVIPAVLLPFDDDLSIDEASFRKHLRDVAATEGLSARHHQRAFDRGRLLHLRRAAARARHRAGRDRRQAAAGQRHLGRRQPRGRAASRSMAAAGGASALLVFPPAPFTHGPERRDGARAFQAHRRRHRPAADRVPVSARDRPGLSERHAAADVRGGADASAPSRTGSATCRSTNGTCARCRTCRGRSTCCRRTARGCCRRWCSAATACCRAAAA